MGWLNRIFARDTAPVPSNSPAAHGKGRKGFGLGGRMVGGIDAARMDRLTASWTGIPVTPDEMIRNWQKVLQARSRDMALNDPHMSRFVRACRANIVGAGAQLRCAVKLGDGTPDTKTNLAVEQSWNEWSDPENCDLTGQQSLRDITLTVVASLAVDGEAFIKVVDAGPWRLQLQLLDPVRCPSDYDLEKTGTGNFIRAGIEYDAASKPVAYYFTADPQHGNYYTSDGRSFQRVPAAEILHIFRKERPTQKRGFPWATSALYRLKRLKGFEDNAATNAEVGAAKMGLITWDEDAGPEPSEDDDGDIHFSAEAGTFAELPSGARLEPWNPAFPTDTVAPFVKILARGAASGMGVSYHTLTGDLESVNYSSIRAGMLDERDLWKEDQRLIVEKFLRPVFRAWLPKALLLGLITNDSGYTVLPRKLTAIRRASTFHPRRWDWVDPKSDATANQKAMQCLVKSPQEIIRDRGRDPEDVLREFSDWKQRTDDLGIPREYTDAAQGAQVKESENLPGAPDPSASPSPVPKETGNGTKTQ